MSTKIIECPSCEGNLLDPPCQECQGHGVVEEIVEPKKTFTVHVTRNDDIYTYRDVEGFEPRENVYLFTKSDGTRVIVPYTSGIYAIEVIPDGE